MYSMLGFWWNLFLFHSQKSAFLCSRWGGQWFRGRRSWWKVQWWLARLWTLLSAPQQPPTQPCKASPSPRTEWVQVEQEQWTGSICNQSAHLLLVSFVFFAFYGHSCPHVEIAGYYSGVLLSEILSTLWRKTKVILFGYTSRKKRQNRLI